MAVLKRTLPTIVAIAAGLVVLAAAFIPDPLLGSLSTYLLDTVVIIAAFALFLGVLNVLRVHARKIRQRQPGRIYSLALIAALLFVLAVGLLPIPGQASGPSQPIVRWIFEYVQLPIQASLSALLVFFILTASYRVLRVRNVESVLMLIVALLVLAGQATAGLVPVLPEVKDWILRVPTVAGTRGILLGVTLGTVLTSIRLLLGVERPYSD